VVFSEIEFVGSTKDYACCAVCAGWMTLGLVAVITLIVWNLFRKKGGPNDSNKAS
jgi:hypothetical protein